MIIIIVIIIIIIIIIIIYSLQFFTSALADGLSLEFEWQKSPQVSRTLLSILADPYNTIVWMVTTFLLIFKFYTQFTYTWGISESTNYMKNHSYLHVS